MEIGDYTYGEPVVKSWGANIGLKIGKFCSFAEDVTIFLGGDHRMDLITTYPLQVVTGKYFDHSGGPEERDVIIGNDVWIGAGATIMSGVTIGDGACIGAKAVVGKDVPPYAIVVGNSARVTRFRFDAASIAKLLKVRWWDWPFETINDQFDLIMARDVDALWKFAQNKGLSRA